MPTRKHMSKKHSGKANGWCMKCKKMMPMVEYKEVDMKMKGGKTRKRLAGKDTHGHNISAIPKKH
jgi:hypothetical protein